MFTPSPTTYTRLHMYVLGTGLYIHTYIHIPTVNREYFVVKIFSDRPAYVKIKTRENTYAILMIILRYRVVCPKII